MRILRMSEDTTRNSMINGTQYRFIRMHGQVDDFTEIIAQKWTGFTWIGVHRWTSR